MMESSLVPRCLTVQERNLHSYGFSMEEDFVAEAVKLVVVVKHAVCVVYGQYLPKLLE